MEIFDNREAYIDHEERKKRKLEKKTPYSRTEEEEEQQKEDSDQEEPQPEQPAPSVQELCHFPFIPPTATVVAPQSAVVSPVESVPANVRLICLDNEISLEESRSLSEKYSSFRNK